MPISSFSRPSWSQSDYARSRWQKDYDDYLARIEQYKNTPFYQELLNNPYYQFQDYQGNFFQGVWANTFDDFSPWDKFYNERKTSGDEYLAQILEAQRVQQYSDPSAEVARRKQAGLNDDLSGGSSIGTGDPGSVIPDETPPVADPNDPLATAQTVVGVASSIGQLAFNFFQSGMSLFSFVQDSIGKSLGNADLDIDLTGKGYEQMIGILAGSSSLPETKDQYEALTEEQKKGLDDSLIEELDAAIKTGSLKGMYQTRRAKRLMKVLRGVVSYDANGKPTLAYEAYRSKLLAQRYGDHKTAAGVIGTPGFDESVVKFGQAISDTFGKIDLAIQKAQQRITEAQARSSEAQASYDQGLLTNELGASDRAARQAQGSLTVSASENQKIIEDMRKSINKEFEELQNKANSIGGIEGMILKLLIPYSRARTEQIIQQGFGAAVINSSGVGTILPSLVK